jgi:hypothetical protein
MKAVCLLVVLAAGLAAQSTNFGQGPITPAVATASISGSLKSSATLGALHGNTITAYRTSPQSPVYRVVGQSAADGTFQISGLPAGTYALCVDGTKDTHLDPCSWGGTPVSVTVADGQKVTGVSLSLIKGVTLKVNINDSGQFLKQRAGEIGPPQVFVAVLPPKGAPAPLSPSDTGNGRQFQMVVPGDTPLTVLVYSKEVTLTDGNQKGVPAAGGTTSVTVASSAASPAPLVFQVTGRTGN